MLERGKTTNYSGPRFCKMVLPVSLAFQHGALENPSPFHHERVPRKLYLGRVGILMSTYEIKLHPGQNSRLWSLAGICPHSLPSTCLLNKLQNTVCVKSRLLYVALMGRVGLAHPTFRLKDFNWNKRKNTTGGKWVNNTDSEPAQPPVGFV